MPLAPGGRETERAFCSTSATNALERENRWLNRVEQVLPLDFLLLDLDIPRMDWYQVLQQFKLQPACTDTLVVILSRRDGLLDRLKARLVGAHDYLSKPFRTQDLLTIIRDESNPGINADGRKRQPRCS